MFYVSSVAESRPIREWRDTLYYDKIGITDTRDNKEEFFTNAECYDLIKKHNLRIYGTYVYGINSHRMFVFATPQKYGVRVSEEKLRILFSQNKEKHNGYSIYPLADYLASLDPIGTRIQIEWLDRADSTGQMFKCKLELLKVDADLWHLSGDSGYRNEEVDSYTAADALDYPSCCKLTKLYAGK